MGKFKDRLSMKIICLSIFSSLLISTTCGCDMSVSQSPENSSGSNVTDKTQNENNNNMSPNLDASSENVNNSVGNKNPENKDNLENEEKPDNNDNPQNGERPDNNDNPQNGERPDNNDNLENGERPDNNDNPENGERPDNGEKPENGEKPDNNNNNNPDNEANPEDKDSKEDVDNEDRNDSQISDKTEEKIDLSVLDYRDLPHNKEVNMLSNVEKKIIELVNEFRAEEGKEELLAEDQLIVSSRYKSNAMIQLDYFNHNNPNLDNQNSAYLIWQYFNINSNAVGENILYITSHSDEVDTDAIAHSIFAAWKASEGHRNNMLSDYFARIGVGVIDYYDESTNTHYIYATQHFTD